MSVPYTPLGTRHHQQSSPKTTFVGRRPKSSHTLSGTGDLSARTIALQRSPARSGIRTAPTSSGPLDGTSPPRNVTFSAHGGSRTKLTKGTGNRVGIADIRATIAFYRQNRDTVSPEETISALLVACDQLTSNHDNDSQALSELQEKYDKLQSEAEASSNALASAQSLLALFERLNFLMELLDPEELEQNVTEIENTVRRYDASFDDMPEREQANEKHLDGREALFALLQRKFKALENLIFVLKKRVLMLENNEDLAESLKSFGSIRTLLDDNTRLKQENAKLRIREQRYASDPLLRRRNLRDYHPSQLHMLILALQNELGHALQLIDVHNIARNPKLAKINAAIVAAEEAAQPELPDDAGRSLKIKASLADLINVDELFAHSDCATPEDLQPVKQSDTSLLQQLEREKQRAEEQVTRLLKERALKDSVVDVTNAFAEMERNREPATLVKEKKLARLTRMVADQITELQELQSGYDAKCAESRMGDEMIKDLQLSKAKLMDDNFKISQRCLRLSEDKRKMRQAVRAQHEKLAAVVSVGKALAMALLSFDPADSEGVETETDMEAEYFVGQLYRDYISAYAHTCSASSRIQACLRGASVRRRNRPERKRMSVTAGLDTTPSMDKGAEAEADRTMSPGPSRSKSVTPDALLAPVPAERPQSPPPGRPLRLPSPVELEPEESSGNRRRGLLPHLLPLCEIILQTEKDVADVATIRHTLQLAKMEVSKRLRGQLERELDRMKKEILNHAAAVNETVKQISAKPQCHIGIQAKYKVRTSGSQWEDEEEEEAPKPKGKKK